MASEKLEGAELKKMVKLAKKKDMPFAFCPGKKKENHVVIVDRRKNPKILAKAAKAEGDSPKVAFGTMAVSGKILELTCERVVPQLAKTLKQYLRLNKITLNVRILDENGNELESDIEDLPDDPEFDQDDGQDAGDDDAPAQAAAPVSNDAPPPPPPPPPGPQETERNDSDDSNDASEETGASAQELAARLKAAQPGVAAVQGGVADKLKAAMAAAVGQIKSGDLGQAEKTVTAIESALAKLGQTPAAPEAAQQANAPDARALAARASALKQAIDGTSEPVRAKLLAALGAAVKAIKGGDLPGAEGGLTKIEAAVQKLGAAPAAPPPPEPAPEPEPLSAEAQKWATAEARLQPLVDKAMAEKRGDLDAINRAFNYAKDLAADGAYDRALAAAGKVAELLKAAAAATTSAAAQEAQDTVQANLVPYVKSRLAWINTRGALRKELEGLKAAIDSATSGIEGLEDVSAHSSVLFTYLDGIDSRLEDTLETLVEAPDGDRREALKTEARGIIDTYRTALDEPFFQAVDNNGFVKTNIRGAALDSLKQVSDALAA
ncbi:MAG: hypothetical protein CML02_13845 [Pseudooceanicola sp.]|nr:hypothetical protein [Pseudooceanicola sp.]